MSEPTNTNLPAADVVTVSLEVPQRALDAVWVLLSREAAALDFVAETPEDRDDAAGFTAAADQLKAFVSDRVLSNVGEPTVAETFLV